MTFLSEIGRGDFSVAATVVKGIEVRPSGPALKGHLDDLYGALDAGTAGGDEKVRGAVRDILRNGCYKPSGRGKPANEYLFKVWKDRSALDLINNVVDVNNLVSLRHGLPISAFDAGKTRGDLTVRLGRSGERFVFNASGQEIDCEDLVVVCDERGPIGSPVKDSQATKLFAGAGSVVYVVYANRTVTPADRLLAITEELGALLAEDCPGAVPSRPVLFGSGQ